MTALQQLGNVASGRRDYGEAQRRFQQALDRARKMQHAAQTTILANLASVSVELKHLDQARTFNAEATRRKRELKDENGLIRSSLIDARIAFASGQMSEAEKILRSVTAAAKVPSAQWEAQARLATVYSLTQRNREAEDQFRSAVSTAGRARESITDRELRLSFTTLVTDVFAAYLDFLIRNNHGAAALEALEGYRAQTLEEGLKSSVRAETFDAREIARQANATILCYWLGPEQSYLWVVNAAGIDLVKLPSGTKLNADLDAYQRQVDSSRGTLTLLASRGERLYKALIAPAGPIPRNSRVIIVPDGKLHAVNLETLVVPGKTSHFWVEDVVLSTAGSLQLIAGPPKKWAGTKMLLVGNPPLVDPIFPRLESAPDEISKVAARFRGAKLLTGSNATPAAYSAADPGMYDYLHFVAHGVATRETPLDSAVILGMDASKSYRLLARDIVKTPLAARLVTISSCYGAGSRNYAGEGLVGLAWAFLRAGADQVIAALWQVNDKATPGLMDDMYKGIRAGRDPAVALREAKLGLIQHGGLYRMPRYWAPFVLYTGR
jgi:CHAT domain-containing protein